MKLLPKFNLILLVLFATGGLIIAEFTKTLLINNARSEVLREAELMMASARSVRDYTASDLAPLLEQNRNTRRSSCRRLSRLSRPSIPSRS